MTERKFYKTLVTVEVLSEEPLTVLSLEQLHYMITDGPCSGHIKEPVQTVLNGKEAADALAEQASDPSFFRLTEAGEDVDE